MQTNKKILLIVAFMLIALAAATIINVALNFRSYSYESAIDKSKMTAVMVRDGLTSHMVNKIMDKRSFFLQNISNYDGVEALWVVRSAKVDAQFGPGHSSERPRDTIDKKVLASGVMATKVTENSDKAKLRVSIPYIADSLASPDCTSCHNVQDGEVLGVVSMEFDISHTRNVGMMTILKIFGINLLFIIIALFLTNHYFKPYMRIFTDLTEMIQHANNGDFSHRITRKISGDGAEVVSQINTLFSNMQGTFSELKDNLTTFVSRANISCSDPLEESKNIIRELADVYKFKRTIELDDTKDRIYDRIAYVLDNKFQVHHFALYEVNKISKLRTLVHISSGESFCSGMSETDAQQCRAHRTGSDVISTEFPQLCKECCRDDVEYICIPFSINNDIALVLSMSAKSKKEMDIINANVSSIKNYFEAAKPVIESRILMDILRDTSLRDGMTGLYNRRFLEEFIDQVMHQANRNKETYSVLMLDIDFFKMVNDTYGHDIGDVVIQGLSKVILDNIRDADLAIRYGGEEFVVMLHNAQHEGAINVAQKIHDAFNALKFNVGNEVLQKTISIGVAHFPDQGDSIWKVIKFADTALYKAKNSGRDQVIEFTPEMFEGEEF